jgi:Na+/H+-dicarboxylate symporter
MEDPATDESSGFAFKRLNLSSRILIGLSAGIACGLFFGEYCAWLSVVGEAFIDLLQMTILPYITAALILNIGKLSADQARRLAGHAGLVLLVLWAVAGVALVVAPLAFPAFEHGSFFSSTMVQPPDEFDPVGLYIPRNPFHSLANNVVPAVVLFSICIGVALIGVERKQGLIDLLEVVCEALTRVSTFVVKLTPYGIFAIAAAAAGTMTLEELGKIHAYLVVYTAVGLVLALWVLPLLVASVTPFSYRQVVTASRDAMVTAFATGKLFVVLPLLIDATRVLFQKLERDQREVEDAASVLVPLAYPFPSVGKLLALLFIPFGAWFVGSPLAGQQIPMLFGTGLLSLFGSPLAAIPFLLDLFRLPADLFNLFVMSGVWSTRISDAVGAMHLFAFSVLASCAMAGMVQIRWRQLAAVGLSVGAVALLVLGGVRMHLGSVMRGAADEPAPIDAMTYRRSQAPHTVLDHASPNPVPLGEGQSRLARIKESGVIRVGFDPEALPFAYFNAAGELVGFDVEMAHRLALELGVAIEFVPFHLETLADQLEEDHFDVAMGGVVATFNLLETAVIAMSGIEVIGALVVRDHLRGNVGTLEAIRALDHPKFGVVGYPWISSRFHEWLPNVELVVIAENHEFFKGEAGDVMALVTIAETGAAWTVRYPDFHVVVPDGVDVKGQLAYPIGGGDLAFRSYVERWAILVREDGTADELHEHWILGGGARIRGPRWSVIRDVLHWVE